MRLHSIVTSSAVLAALCTMLMGGCGGGTLAEEGSDPTSRDENLNSGGSGGEAAPAANGKIQICHVPPGNPANAHTITVSPAAWAGHSHHPGDHLGACEGDGGGEADGGVSTPEDGGTSEPDAGTPDAGPTCAPPGSPCDTGAECCTGLVCGEGVCQPRLG